MALNTTLNVFHGADTYEAAQQAAAEIDNYVVESVAQDQVVQRSEALRQQGVDVISQTAHPDDANLVNLRYIPPADFEEAKALQEIPRLFALVHGTHQTRRKALTPNEEDHLTQVFNAILAAHPQFPVNVENFKARTHLYGIGERVAGLYRHPQGFAIEFAVTLGQAPNVALTNFNAMPFVFRVNYFKEDADIVNLLALDGVAQAVFLNIPRFNEQG